MDREVKTDMLIIRVLGPQRSLACIWLLFLVALTSGTIAGVSRAAAQDREIGAAEFKIAQTTMIANCKFIDDHPCINPFAVIQSQDPPREKFLQLHYERHSVIAILDQKQAELYRLLQEPHRKPVPVPTFTQADYNARVGDIDAKIHSYEAQQNNKDLTETQRAEAHAQLLDLTGQKARAALELITYRRTVEEQSNYDKLMNQEAQTKSTILEASSYLSNIDDAISELMGSNDAETQLRKG
jgi:hypothetical protein